MTGKRLIRKVVKITALVIGCVIALVLVLFIFINTNYGKTVVKNRVVSYMQNKFKTKVVIGSIDYSVPKWLKLKGVYIEDRRKDTLLYGEEMAIDLNMIGLLRGVTYIRKVELKNMYVNMYRLENDTTFNFDFVVNSFTGQKVANAVVDTSALKLTLNELFLDRVRLNFKDDYAGSSFQAVINKLNATLNKFQPDRLQFGIDKFDADSVDFLMNIVKLPIPDTTSGTDEGMYLSLTSGESDIRNLNVVVNDKTTGMYYANNVRHLLLTDGSIDLLNQKIKGGKAQLDSSVIAFVAPKPIVKDPADTTVSPFWDVRLNDLQMKYNVFKYDDNTIAPQKDGLDPAHLELSDIFANAKQIHYSLDTMSASVQQLKFKDKSAFRLDSTHANLLYTKNGISATELYVKTPNSLIQNTLEIKYDDVNTLATAPQNSDVSIKLDNSIIAINDIYALMPSVKKMLDPSKFSNTVLNLNTEIQGNFQRLNIPFLQLRTSAGSNINARAILYNVTDNKKMSYDIYVFNSSLQKSDVAKFLPDEQKTQFQKFPNTLNLTAHLKGDMKQTTTSLDVSGGDFRFAGQGSVQNFDNPAALKYDVNIKQGRVTKSFINSLLPPNTFPEAIRLPDLILMSGTAKGDMNNIQTNMKLDGSYGVATINGTINNFKDPETAKYDVQLSGNEFELGKLMNNDSMIGKISFSGSATGRGFNYKTMSADISSKIQSITLQKYTYRDLDIHATFNNGNVKSEGTINDPAIRLQYDVAANLKTKYPSGIAATMLIDTLLLGRLNLVKDTVSFAGKVYIDAPDLDPNHLDGYASIDSVRLNVKNKNYFIDSILAKANTTPDSGNVISLASPLADITAKGNFEYDQVGKSLIQYIDAYYNITDQPAEQVTPQQISFEGDLKKHELIPDLIPGLQYDNIHFNGSYASQYGDSALNLTATAPYFQYTTTKMNNGRLAVSSKNNAIAGDLDFDKIEIGENILYATNVHARASEDSLSVDALTKDIQNRDRFGAGVILLSQKDNTYEFSIKNNLLMDYKKWDVAPDNRITYSDKGVLVNNFVLSNNNSKISATSRTNVLNSPVDVKIENFDIRDVTSIFNNDTLFATGLVNGTFTLNEFDKEIPAFTGNLELSDFHFMQQPIGTIKLFASKEDNNTINTNLSLSGNGNEITVEGNYYLNNTQNEFDVDADIKSLNVATLQAFSEGNLIRSKGTITGGLTLNGKFSDPRWQGVIEFDTTQFTVTKFGAQYKLDKQKVILDYPNISFRQFTIRDSLSHPLMIDGNIKSNSLIDYDLALEIDADDFILVNAPKAINNEIYGFAAIDADVSLTGSSARPNIEGSLSLNDRSDITMVLPEQNINKDAARSIVRFIDRDTFAIPEKEFSPAIEPASSFAQFLNYNLNIEVSKKAVLTVIVDPSTGDELKVQGDAQLTAGVDPGGHIVLVGNYELNNGYYILNYQFIQRQFSLLPSSTIVFSGEPMDAQINITAEYIVNTASKDLLGNEVGEVDPKVSNTFNQKIPFRVLLYLKGAMKRPDISFDIQLPDENVAINSQLRTTIENKLTQLRGDVTATNKQVFSLLLLNRFAGEQSTDFFRGSGEGFNDIARESVSKFLSSALDQIAGDIFKGVDIDLNINSYKDYSSGDIQQKTDFNVAVSKSFLDDRLSISVGKNFGIEGDDAVSKSQKSNSYLPDVTVNYKLSKDGKYMLRAYKKDQYEVILDGYVVETGVAFILTLDYDKFRELFRRK
ncbi:MAG: translocation/assembly module TamB domain-containing protein [Bacteroidota bacterium]